MNHVTSPKLCLQDAARRILAPSQCNLARVGLCIPLNLALAKRGLLLGATLLLPLAGAQAQNGSGNVAYVRSTIGQPWGRADNDGILTKVFTNWLDLRYETVKSAALFSATNKFVFLEGGADSGTIM